MPELPEVETIKKTLGKRITGLTITGVTVNMPKIISEPEIKEFVDRITHSKINKLGRRGKYLLLYLTGEQILIIHLRMTGQMIYSKSDEEIAKHTHVIFKLSDGNELRFIDMRQFGRLQLVDQKNLDQVKGLKDLGPEPLEKEFTSGFLRRELKGKRTRVKPLLLDQTFIAGLGNIYADEALHRAHLHPKCIAGALSPRESSSLYRSIREVLQEGIQHRGTTFKDYVDGEGNKGGFQKLLRVYNREGEQCTHCGGVIQRVKLNGRSAYYCPACQKE